MQVHLDLQCNYELFFSSYLLEIFDSWRSFENKNQINNYFNIIKMIV